MKYKILITGYTGFVGQNLLEYLQKENRYHITGVTRDKTVKNYGRFIPDNIITYSELFEIKNKYESIIHLAGQVIKENEDHNSELEYIKANYYLAKNIYDYFLTDNITEKFIFLSSIHVLTEIPDRIIDESYPPIPFTSYGRSKYQAENYILSRQSEKKHTYILRPTMIHGPGNKGNLKSLYRYLSAGWPYLLGSINNKRSFLSIENLCFVIREIINNDIEDGLYHIADDDPTETHQLIHDISKISGKNIKKYNIHVKLLRLLAILGNYTPIPFDVHRFGKLTSDFIVKNDKIKSAIGKPLPVTSKEGMRRTLESFVNE